MRALTLHQPWASLIADGRKAVETRSWAPPVALLGERIAIHAGKVVDKYYADDWYAGFPLPIGCVVCTAVLADMGQIRQELLGKSVMVQWWRAGLLEHPVDPYGDFALSRWLWRLDDVEAVSPPIPARGHQGIWVWG